MKTIGRVRRLVRSAGLGVLRYMPKTRLAVRHTYWRHEAKKYDAQAAKIAVNPKRVFFESFGGRSFSCSPRALFLAMCADERFADYEFIWSFKGAGRTEEARENPALRRATVVQRGSAEYFEGLASSGTLILNTRLPEYVTPKADQVFVQCWHGTPLKRLGYDVRIETANALNTTSELAERFGMDAKKWTYLLSPSPYTSEHLASAFGLPVERRAQTVLELGYPRNDDIARAAADASGETVRAMREKFGVPEGKRALLYAPTWRDDSYKAGVGYTFDYLIDFDELQHELGDEWVVLFRPHYYIANAFDFSAYEGFVIDASDAPDINELYIAADALVTDYSSVMFDYAILRRPILLFVPDYERYADDIRGFYFDMAQVPGPQCTTTEELSAQVKELDGTYWQRYGEAFDHYAATFCPLDDGHASQRVLERVFVG